MDDILIVRNKGNKMTAKVRKRMVKGFAPDDYTKVLNPRDSNDLALLFEDLSLLYSSPIEKAFRRYHEKKTRGFPF